MRRGRDVRPCEVVPDEKERIGPQRSEAVRERASGEVLIVLDPVIHGEDLLP